MELRLDRLLALLRDRPEAVLAAIDADPLLVKRLSADLVLANATQKLYTPAEPHQLFAKGIVYRRDPYRLVSLPLVKIYNVGERDVTVAHLGGLAGEPGVRLRFLRKMDGSLVQLFRAGGRAYFTTRGMIEGGRLRPGDEADPEERRDDFDYLAEARRLAEAMYPQVLADETALEGRTLVFELIHPQARIVTDYGDLADLILLAAFDHRRVAYVDYDELGRLAGRYGLRVVEALSPPGEGLAEQIDALLASLAGTDEEGSVVCLERAGEVVYRVKVKSPEYLQLMRLMAFCTYDRTVELIDARPEVRSWPDLKRVLQEQGRERVPEEVLAYYKEHWDRFEAYLADLGKLRAWAKGECARLEAEVAGEGRERRKGFAARAVQSALPGLVFAALDGRLDVAKLRKVARTPEEAREMLGRVGGEGRGL